MNYVFKNNYIMCLKIYALSLFFSLCMFSLLAQKRIFVNISATGANNGQTWADAFVDLHQGLAAAKAGDSVWVAQGIYRTDPTGSDRRRSFVLSSGVRLFGGFVGGETRADQRNWAANPAVLSGDIGTTNDSTDNAYTVLYMANPDSSTVLDGFTLERGNADYSGMDLPARVPEKCGGALFIMALDGWAYPDIRNCVFQYNYALVYGGAVYINGGGVGSVAPRFLGCLFRHNRTNLDGGAVYRDGASWADRVPDFGGCRFEDNKAGRRGGGLYFSERERTDRLDLSYCVWERNTAATEGGGACFNLGRESGSLLRIFGCRFSDNPTPIGDAYSAIEFNALSLKLLEIDSCHFELQKGQGILANSTAIGGKQVVQRCTFLDGRNIFNDSDSIIIKKCKFYMFQNIELGLSIGYIGKFVNNQIFSKYGASINNNSSLFFSQNLVWVDDLLSLVSASNPLKYQIFNNFFRFGKFDHTSSSNTPKFTVSNSALIDVGNNVGISNASSFRLIFSHCYLSGIECGSLAVCAAGNLLDIPPHFRDTLNGDFRLQPWSPLVDAGDNAAAAGLASDFAGQPRIQNGRVDIGAFELGPFRANLSSKPACGAFPNGGIAAIPLDECPPLAATWIAANGGTGQNLNNLPAGTYAVTLTDACGRTYSDTLAVPQAPQPNLSLETTDVACGTAQGGRAEALAQGGTPPLAYRWQDGANASQREQLPAGRYAVTVADANGCQDSAFAQIALRGALGLLVGGRPISCFGDRDGAASATPLLGQAPYRYNWNNGAQDSLLTNLAPGLYTVSVSDARSCQGTFSFNLSEPDPLKTVVVSNDATANGVADGSAQVSGVTGGTSPYRYAWNTGAISPDITLLLPGTYTVTVTDNRGCTAVQMAVIKILNAVGDPKTGGTLLFFPNPAIGSTTVRGQTQEPWRVAALRLLDAQGRPGPSIPVTPDGDGVFAHHIRLDGLTPGTYQAILLDGQGKVLGSGTLEVFD